MYIYRVAMVGDLVNFKGEKPMNIYEYLNPITASARRPPRARQVDGRADGE